MQDGDSFLQSLADGGFQVGALGRQYYPGGVLVESSNLDEAVEQTRNLLMVPDVTVFEDAVRHGDLIARVDVLVKTGDRVNLVEVKSKSIDSVSDSFLKRSKKKPPALIAEWIPYLVDVAFQRVVFARVPAIQCEAVLDAGGQVATCYR